LGREGSRCEDQVKNQAKRAILPLRDMSFPLRDWLAVLPLHAMLNLLSQ
jgi:hypothetical protein